MGAYKEDPPIPLYSLYWAFITCIHAGQGSCTGGKGRARAKHGANAWGMGLPIAMGLPHGLPSQWKSQKIGQGATKSDPHPIEIK